MWIFRWSVPPTARSTSRYAMSSACIRGYTTWETWISSLERETSSMDRCARAIVVETARRCISMT